jgi:hypothetical protein
VKIFSQQLNFVKKFTFRPPFRCYFNSKTRAEPTCFHQIYLPWYKSTTMKPIYPLLFFMSFYSLVTAQEWYQLPKHSDTRWSSFENLNGAKGQGGQANKTAKGHAFEALKAGQSVNLLDIQGAGIIHRIWLTVSDRSPEMLRALRIDMYWDGAAQAAVSAPLGDFFGVGLGRTTAFENVLFSNPEGRSFNCNIPMPFRKAARISISNESDKDLNLLFFDVNYELRPKMPKDLLYFHAHWVRSPKNELAKDIDLLPRVEGCGRYLGVNMGVIADSVYLQSWFGEGEVKIYLDGDGVFPTLNGTGTEDYIGTGWGQGKFVHQYQGCLIADEPKRHWAFYRYHVPDPVYFRRECRVTIQMIGGDGLENVRKMAKAGAELIPISVDAGTKFYRLFEMNPSPNLHGADFPNGWTNFYRRDDVSATAYFYLDRPQSNLAPLAKVQDRMVK